MKKRFKVYAFSSGNKDAISSECWNAFLIIETDNQICLLGGIHAHV